MSCIHSHFVQTIYGHFFVDIGKVNILVLPGTLITHSCINRYFWCSKQYLSAIETNVILCVVIILYYFQSRAVSRLRQRGVTGRPSVKRGPVNFEKQGILGIFRGGGGLQTPKKSPWLRPCKVTPLFMKLSYYIYHHRYICKRFPGDFHN